MDVSSIPRLEITHTTHQTKQMAQCLPAAWVEVGLPDAMAPFALLPPSQT